MASIVTSPKSGGRMIQFFGKDKKRRKLRLGKVTMKQAETVRLHVEELVACQVCGTSPKGTTTEWLTTVPDWLRERLERVKLVEPREGLASRTLDDWLQEYIQGRSDIKEGSRVNLDQTRRNLVAFFGADKAIDEIVNGDGERFRKWLKEDQKLSEGTIRRRCKRARQFFAEAVKRKLLSENVFASVKCGSYANPSRRRFVSKADSQRVLDVCTDAEFRCIFALCRYGGLRCPTEVLRLKWEDVDWDNGVFTVHSSKTEHCEDGGVRLVPIFPELRRYLEAWHEQSQEGAEYVITRYRESNTNLRTRLMRIIRRAGLTPWPKLFQNLRATRATEIKRRFGEHLACMWLGHTQEVAEAHYWQTTARDVEDAMAWEGEKSGAECGAQEGQKAGQQAAAGNRVVSQPEEEKGRKGKGRE